MHLYTTLYRLSPAPAQLRAHDPPARPPPPPSVARPPRRSGTHARHCARPYHLTALASIILLSPGPGARPPPPPPPAPPRESTYGLFYFLHVRPPIARPRAARGRARCRLPAWRCGTHCALCTLYCDCELCT
jgi:hypothetical protein